ncbi:MAG: PilZ domain-containing protein [Treponemataceae bacterium]|nr:MAG: PilZ domain-containing protein [Treponemataceae bacterium]
MGIITSQKISWYYNQYQVKDITISREIAKALCLDLRQILVKWGDAQWPCIINTTSLSQAKIIIGTNSGAYTHLVKEKGNANLRFYFEREKGQVISFFVASKVINVAPYGDSEGLVIVTLQFTQRPPDDLIAILGEFIEANVNFVSRKDERITLTPDIKRKLGLSKDETVILIQGVPRHCIVRDISFCGARVILLGLKKFLMDKEVLLRFEFEDSDSSCDLNGVITDVELVQDRRDISVAVIHFVEKTVPMFYKQKINSYITTIKRSIPLPNAAALTPPTTATPTPPNTAEPSPTAPAAPEAPEQ